MRRSWAIYNDGRVKYVNYVLTKLADLIWNEFVMLTRFELGVDDSVHLARILAVDEGVRDIREVSSTNEIKASDDVYFLLDDPSSIDFPVFEIFLDGIRCGECSVPWQAQAWGEFLQLLAITVNAESIHQIVSITNSEVEITCMRDLEKIISNKDNYKINLTSVENIRLSNSPTNTVYENSSSNIDVKHVDLTGISSDTVEISASDSITARKLSDMKFSVSSITATMSRSATF